MDLIPGAHWYSAREDDPRGFALYQRHYSAKHRPPGRSKHFVGPGEKMVLLTAQADAVFVWRLERPRMRRDGQTGVYCVIFRNESPYLSSELIREAEALAWARWPGQRLFTHVREDAVASPVPGWCFIRARWKRSGRSANGLLQLEKRPRVMSRNSQ